MLSRESPPGAKGESLSASLSSFTSRLLHISSQYSNRAGRAPCLLIVDTEDLKST